MKKILTIILILFAVQGMAQDSNYLELWNGEYYDECSEIVSDTIIEHGVVNYDINAVDGELKLIPIDTVWDIEKCSEYKELQHIPYSDYSWGNNYLTYSSTSATIDTLGGYRGALEWVTVGSTKEKFTTTITREKVCVMRLRQPTREHFWEWLKENEYRK